MTITSRPRKMSPSNISLSTPAFFCSTCFLRSLPPVSPGCYLSRRSLPPHTRRVRTSSIRYTCSTLLLSASADSNENPQTEVASTQLSSTSSDSPNSPNWNRTTDSPPSSPSSPSSSSPMQPLSSSTTSPSPCSKTSSSPIPIITSVSLNFNGSDPLPSLASLKRYMNDLRPKLDYLEPRARERVLSALEVANVAHSGQMRKSGEPFIIHPIAVAAILADLRMDRDCIIAGLLHDTVEDTTVTLEDLETLFGTDVRRIVEGETKLSNASKKMRSGQTHEQSVDVHDKASRAQHEVNVSHDSSSKGKGGPDTSSTSTTNIYNSSVGFPALASDSQSMARQDERDTREEEIQKQADNLQAMFIAMAEDVRVIIVKLADRLHNMRTLAYMSPAKQKKISKETLEFFAPLAHRLGMRRIKSELEELSFMYLHPEDYNHLKYEVETMLIRSKFDHNLKSAEATIKDVLRQDRFLYNMIRSVEVTGSTKELYCIYRRIQAGENLSAMLDIATMRVVVDLDPGVDSNQACYHVLGRIHTMWKPYPKRLKDYIAFPKPNGYQSFHTTVLLGQKFDFLTMEIQIRTAEMHRIAEEGIAAQLFMAGQAKSIGNCVEDDKDDGLDNQWRRRTTSWLINIREYIKEFSSSKDLVDAVRKDLLGNRVFVFTPKGSIVDLPKDSTPIDVAYRIHSDVGNSMIGSEVNGRMVSLDYKLQNADVVKIISSKCSKGPSPEWISYAKSRTARQKIRQFLRARDRDNMLDRGRRLLEDEARALLEPVPSENGLTEVIPRLCDLASTGRGDKKMSSVEDLYFEIARRSASRGVMPLERTVLRLLRDRRHNSMSKAMGRGRVRWEEENVDGAGQTGKDVLFGGKVEAMLAPCCQPIRGDEVQGVWMRDEENDVVIVHRKGCEHVRDDCGSRLHVKWAARQREVDDGVQQGREGILKGGAINESEDGEGRQPARVVVVSRDCTGLLAYVTGVIASMGTSIQRCSTLSDRDGMTATLAFEVVVRDAFHLRRIIERLEDCDEVESVGRVGPNDSPKFFGADVFSQRCGCQCGRCDTCDTYEEAVCAELLRHAQGVELNDLEICV